MQNAPISCLKNGGTAFATRCVAAASPHPHKHTHIRTPPQVRVIESVTDGLENIGTAFANMMRGGNLGKAVVKVAEHDPFAVPKH